MEVVKRKRGWFLYLLGIVVTILGLCGSNLDYFPFLRPIITPVYFRAQTGFDTLMRNQQLTSGDNGFAELAQMASKRVTFNGKKGAAPPIKKFSVGQPMVGFGANNTGGFYHPIVIEFPDGQTVQGDLEDFRADLATLKSTSNSKYSIAVALVGILIGFFGFLQKGQ